MLYMHMNFAKKILVILGPNMTHCFVLTIASVVNTWTVQDAATGEKVTYDLGGTYLL